MCILCHTHTPSTHKLRMFMFLFNFRGSYGHYLGKRPWIIGDETLTGLMTDIVGKYKINFTKLIFSKTIVKTLLFSYKCRL